jgi:hypothetical protein
MSNFIIILLSNFIIILSVYTVDRVLNTYYMWYCTVVQFYYNKFYTYDNNNNTFNLYVCGSGKNIQDRYT